MFNLIASLLVAVIGAMSVVTYTAVGDNARAQAEIKQLKADLKAARDDNYDRQWMNNAEIEDTNNQQIMAMSVLQHQLDTCRAEKGKKP